MKISIIAAMARNRVIGRGNSLPWRLPADLERFKRLTMGHCLLMGRKTFESIGRALPGRSTIVISRQREYSPPGVLVARSLDEALSFAAGRVKFKVDADEVFVAGGAQIYEQALPRAGRMYLTLIDADFEGDAFFPEFDESAWRVVSEERHDATDGQPYAFRYVDYERLAPAGQP